MQRLLKLLLGALLQTLPHVGFRAVCVFYSLWQVVSKEQRQARLAEIQEDEEKSSGESAPVDHMQGGTPAAV